jgi:5'-deoxynucleotidase YfbR-like HD superfamily hydrolase
MFVSYPLGSEMVDVNHNLLQAMLHDVEETTYNARLQAMLHDVEETTYNARYHEFTRLVSDSETPLYDGCKAKHTKLVATLDLMKLKACRGWTNKSFTELLDILKDLLLEERTHSPKRHMKQTFFVWG